ncbi:hypothetical protein GCM10007978_06620 [Shewanella hanedai]|nr:hypothetical protein GCM10007978_06620 [Shewanella hanedai]
MTDKIKKIGRRIIEIGVENNNFGKTNKSTTKNNKYKVDIWVLFTIKIPLYSK